MDVTCQRVLYVAAYLYTPFYLTNLDSLINNTLSFLLVTYFASSVYY